MTDEHIVPIILCGGSGSRLQPFSTLERPKPFLRLADRLDLLQATLLRFRTQQFSSRPIIVASQRDAELLSVSLSEISIDADIVFEEMQRNTFAATLCGGLKAATRGTDPLLLICPADHDVKDDELLRQSIALAADAAKSGWFVTFGIRARSASSDYGYVVGGKLLSNCCVQEVSTFVEKPNAAFAAELLERGALWNSGIFLVSVGTLLEICELLQPTQTRAIKSAFQTATVFRRNCTIVRYDVATVGSVPVDKAIVEKCDRRAVLPIDIEWSDVGTVEALRARLPIQSIEELEMSTTLFDPDSRDFRCVRAGFGESLRINGPERVVVMVVRGRIATSEGLLTDGKHIVFNSEGGWLTVETDSVEILLARFRVVGSFTQRFE